MTANYSGVYLIACAGVLIAARAARPSTGTGTHSLRGLGRALGETAFRFGALLVLAFTVWWAGHGFAVTGPLSETSFAGMKNSALAIRVLGRGQIARSVIDFAHTHLPEPAPLRGLLFQVSHNRLGQEAFLMGERSQFGWPSFFPTAYALKSTPVELGLTGLLLALLAGGVLSLARGGRTVDPAMAALAVCAGTYVGLLLTSHIDIGHRFLLPVYPLVILAACDRIGLLLNGRRGLFAMAGIALVGAQAVSAASVWPHSLSYFNALAGGPVNGWHQLVDSSIDWGQDLPALARVLNSASDKPTALSYFGSAVPAAYGVRADDIRALTRPPDEYERVAISVTHLQGLYVKGTDAFRWFLDQMPSARAGYSIFVYDLDTPERRAAFRAAAAAITSGGR
jgi:hypothetical protein